MLLARALAVLAFLALECPAQHLLFKSGFESNTAVGAIPGGSTGGLIQPMTGTDLSTGYTWPIPLFGAPSSGMGLKVGAGGGLDVDHYTSAFVTETGHTGSSTRALHLDVDGFASFTCCPQYVFQSSSLAQPMQEVYYSVWVMWPSSLSTQLDATSNWGGRELLGWKSTSDYRDSFQYSRSGTTGHVLYGSLQSDPGGKLASNTHTTPYVDPVTGAIINQPDPQSWKFAQVQNSSYALPIGSWNHVEVYMHRVHGPGGRYFLAVNGHVIGDYTYTSTNYGAYNEEVQDLYWTTLYGSIYPLIQDIDDIEIWDKPPCSNLPCDGQVGGAPPAITNWQGSVATVGVPYTHTPVVSNSPTSWHYDCLGGTCLPAGLSFNTSTGVISGTPTTPGTYKVFLNADNATGRGVQEFEIQINSAVQAPVIKTFGAYPTTVASGGSSTLYANVLGAGSVSVVVDQAVGTLSGLSASKTVTPGATTTYKLTVSNPAGSVSASTTVTVTGSTAPPSISSLTANPGTITAGSSSNLSLASSGATSCSVDQGVGTVPCNGSKLVTPAATTTYKATVTNPYGSDTRSVTVTVNPVSTFTPVVRGRHGALL